MSNNYEILPSYRSDRTDRLIMNWDYDEYGRWGQKQYIRCFLAILFTYCLLFYSMYYLLYVKMLELNGNKLE